MLLNQVCLTVVFVLLSYSVEGAEQPFTLIHASDTHICDLENIHPVFAQAREHCKGSTRNLRNLLTEIVPKVGAQAVILTGDLTDFHEAQSVTGEMWAGSIERFQELSALSPVPLWLTLGNHDLGSYRIDSSGKIQISRHNASRSRAWWIKTFDCFADGTNYEIVRTIGKTAYHLIFLDNDFPLRVKTAGRVATRYQLDWLEYCLHQAKADPVLILMHAPLSGGYVNREGLMIPLPPGGAFSLKSYNEFVRILESSPSTAVIFCGHTHNNGVKELKLPSGKKVIQVQTGDLVANAQD